MEKDIQSITNRASVSIALASMLGTLHSIAFVSSAVSASLGHLVISPLAISAILLIKRISRTAFDIPTGIVGDMFGPKVLLLGSMLATTIASIMLYKNINSVVFIIIALCLKGLSDSCINGKIEAHIYSTLELEKQTQKFSKMVSLYYFFAEAVSALALWLVSVLLPETKHIMLYSMIVGLFGIAFSALLKESSKMQVIKRPPLAKIFLELKKSCKDLRVFVVLLTWGMCTFLGWQMHSITAIMMVNFGFSTKNIITVQGAEHFALAVGCLFSLVASSKINTTNALCGLIFSSATMLICAIIHTPFAIITSTMIYLCMFCSLEVFLEKQIIRLTSQSSRMTMSSLATTITSVYNVIGTMLFGFFVELFGQRVGWSILCLIIVLYVLFITLLVLLKGGRLSFNF